MKTIRDAYPYGVKGARRRTQPGDAELPPLVEEGTVLRHGPRKLAILLATRGTVFSRAIESIIREGVSCLGFEVLLLMTHGMPIPDAQSNLITRALAWGADVTWLVEEDNYMPHGVLRALLKLNAEVATCDYYNHEGSGWVVLRKIGKLDFYAFGCTLVASSVWQRIGAPYCFRGRHIDFGKDGEPREAEKFYLYGGQDIDFSFRLHRLGIKGARLSGAKWRCGHLSILKHGTRGVSNHGSHEIIMS